MLKKAKKEAPSIIFIDEIDSIGRVRGIGLGGGHDEREQTLNQILAEMDGLSPHESVVVMAATNRPDVLDPALIRPGRFDRRITLELPQKDARRMILETHSREVPLADNVNLKAMAERTPGLSGADLKNLVNEAALMAARKNKQQVEAEDLELARRMVCQWGMSEKLGPVTFSVGEPHPFLGRELTEARNFSEYTARLIDEEVQSIVKKREQSTEKKLADNREVLEALTEGLLEHETLSSKEVDRSMETAATVT
jgi:ATP-dependent Zn protease